MNKLEKYISVQNSLRIEPKSKRDIGNYDFFNEGIDADIRNYEKLLDVLKKISFSYKEVKSYVDYFNLDMDMKPSNIGFALHPSYVSTLKNRIDEFDFSVITKFDYKGDLALYYKIISELYAGDHFSKNGFELSNATQEQGNEGGVDFKINKNSKSFYVEVVCRSVYNGEELKPILNSSGVQLINNEVIANRLRDSIEKKVRKVSKLTNLVKNLERV
jgi:hypothetical protein